MREKKDLFKENRELKTRLNEVEELLAAIKSGSADNLFKDDQKVLMINGSGNTYRILIESMNEGVVALAVDGTIMYCNRSFIEMAGVGEEKIIGSSIFNFFNPEENSNFRLFLSKSVNNTAGAEFRLKTKNKSLLPVLVSCNNIKLDYEGFCLVITDLTHQKNTELDLRNYREHLEELVKVRTAGLQESEEKQKRVNDELEERVNKRTEEVLKEHQRFINVLNMLPVYTLLLSPDYHVTFANNFFEERFGKSNGKCCFEYLFNRTAPCENCETYKVLKTNEPQHWEWTGPDGHNYDIYDFPFTDLNGSQLIMEVGIDITQRKVVQDELRKINENLEKVIEERTLAVAESRKQLYNIYYTMVEGLVQHEIVYDDAGLAVDYIIVEANPAYEKITGLKVEEIKGKKGSEIYGIGEAPYLDIYAKVALTGEPASFEEYFAPMEKYFAISVFSPAKGKFVTVFSDITERKKSEEVIKKAKDEIEKQAAELFNVNKTLKESRLAALNLMEDSVLAKNQAEKLSEELMIEIGERKKTEEILKESEQRLRFHFENSPLGVIEWNGDFIITQWSGEAEHIFGWKKEEVLGKKIDSLNIIYAEDIALVNNTMERLTRGKERTVVSSNRNYTKSGNIIECVWYNSVLLDKNGQMSSVISLIQDITEKVRSEERIRQSEERLNVIVSNTPDHILVQDRELRYEFIVNPQLGLKEEVMIGKNDYDILSKEDAERLTRIKRQVMETLQPVTLELPLTSLSGTPEFFIGTYKPRFSASGQVNGIIGYFKNITEKKKTEEELKQSEKKFRTLFNTMNEGFSIDEIICNENGEPYNLRFLEVNPAFEIHTGLKAADIIDKTFFEVFPETERAWIERFGKVALKGEPDHFEAWFNPLGKYFEISAYQIGHGRFAVVFFNITQRKEDEKLLLEREENLRAILNATKESIFMFDKEGKIVSANLTAAKRMNHTPSEIIGHPFTEFMTPELAKERWKYLNKVFESAQPLQFEDERSGIIFAHNFYPVLENNNVVRVVSFSVDITVRRRTEEQIRKLSRAVEQSPDSIIITDTNGNIEYVNPKFTEVSGFAPEEVIGENPRLFKSGYTKPEVYKNLWETISKGSEWHGHINNRKKNGELFWESVNISPIRNGKGVITHYIAIKEDITESVEKEKVLNKLNRTLNALRHNGDAILSASDELSYMQEVCNIIMEDCGYAMIWIGFAEDDNKTVIPVVSAGFEEGYLQTLNITWADTERGRGPTGTAIRTGKPSICNNMITDPHFKPWRAEAIKRAYASSVSLPLKTTEKIFGAITIYSSEPESFKEDEVNLLIELAEDFTYGLSVVKLRAEHSVAVDELKKHRDHLEELVERRTEELLTANEILKEAQEVAQIGNWRLDLTTNYLEWSGEVFRIFGVESGSFSVSFEAFFDIVHPDDRDFVSEAFWNSIKNKTLYNIDHKIIRPGGEIRIVHERCVTHYDSDEQPLYSLGIVQDITELKKIEKEIELHRAHLEDLVKVRTEELAIANKDLKNEIEREKQVEMLLHNSLEKEKELNELKSRFISTTSHEFRTPLASILSSVQLIQRYRKKWNDAKLEDQFVKIKSSIFNLTSLLDDILTISRADSGRIVFNPQKLNLYDYCLELYDEVKHKATKNHKFIFKCAEKEKEFTLDPKLMRFIIGNLLSNAFKYSPSGGNVVLAVTSDQNELRISVSDEGLGISPEDKENLFKPFFRAKNSRDIEGTGLGLSIVQRAVQMHKGEINFQSAEGKGTKFFIKIPVE